MLDRRHASRAGLSWGGQPLNWKRPVMIVVIGAAVGAWLTSAMTIPGTQSSGAAVAKPMPIEARGAALATEIARLHERLRPDTTPREPGRNLFAFRAEAPSASSPAIERPLAAMPEIAARPALKLSGIAEDAAADGPVRTAIISAAGQLFLVKEGEAVTSQYRVSRIFEDSVELTDVEGTTTLRLSLK